MRLATRLGIAAGAGLSMAMLVRPLLFFGLWFMNTTFEGEVGWWSCLQAGGMFVSLVVVAPSLLLPLVLPDALADEVGNAFVFVVTFVFWGCLAFLLLAGSIRSRERHDP